MTDDGQTFDELVEEVAIQENADPEIVRLAFEVQQDIKKFQPPQGFGCNQKFVVRDGRRRDFNPTRVRL